MAKTSAFLSEVFFGFLTLSSQSLEQLPALK
jgi:hypothetical protein